MRTNLLLPAFLLLFASITVSAQEDEDRINAVQSYSIDTDQKGNTYVCGDFQGIVYFGRHTLRAKGGTDAFLAKFDPKGRCVWAVDLGGKENDMAKAIKVDKKGNSYVTGYFSGNAKFDYKKLFSRGWSDAYLAKFNPSGGLIWIEQIGGEGDDAANALDIDPAGNLYVTGGISQSVKFGIHSISAKGGTDIFLAKYTGQGKHLWAQSAGTLGLDIAYGVTAVGSKGCCITGVFDETVTFGETSLTTKGNADIFLAKYSTGGTPEWATRSGAEKSDQANAITMDQVGNFYVCGNVSSFEMDALSSIYIAKHDKEGKLLWSKEYEAETAGAGHAIEVDQKGNLYIAGDFTEHVEFGNLMYNELGLQSFFGKFNAKGEGVWVIVPGSGKDASGQGITLGPKGDVYATGSYHGSATFCKEALSSAGTTNAYIARNNVAGQCVWAIKAGEPDALSGYDPNVQYVDYKGKLLVGNATKRPLVEKEVVLKDSTGSQMESTVTDEYGDFTFRNLNSKVKYSIDLDMEGEGSESIFLASQTGVLIGEMKKGPGNSFQYELLPKMMTEMALMDEHDVGMQLDAFLKGGLKEGTVNDIVYYAPGQWQVPEEFKRTLLGIVKTMKRVPTLNLEVISHTDSNGDDQANLTLSEKRAKAIVDFIKAKKIGSEKLSSKGMGETQLLNRCGNGVTDCSGQEHQANRRTELRFFKK